MSRLSTGVFRTLVLCLILASTQKGLAVVSGVSIACSDRRFDAVGVFLTSDSATGCGGALSGTCTLIAPDRILVARHCLDVGPSNPIPTNRYWIARFRRAPSGDAANTLWVNGSFCHGVYTERRVVQIIDAPLPNNADQVVCILDTPVVGIRPIGVELNNPPRAIQEVIVAGWGFDGGCFASGDWGTLRAARGNMPANFATNDYLVFSPCALSGQNPCSALCPPTQGPYVLANLYDSGAPVLIEVAPTDPFNRQKELRLVGTVSSTTAARRPSAFNNAWGPTQPTYVLRQARGDRNAIADFNADGRVNIDDVLTYIAAFTSGGCLADLNNAGSASIDNLFIFLNAFFAAQSQTTP